MEDKKVAIMQPYVFPYLGYFQLIQAVDTFVFYDDVNFIKQGWINRNKILVNNDARLFTIPVKNVSSFEEIRNTEVNHQNFKLWKKKFLKTIIQNYNRAPYFENTQSIIEKVLNEDLHSISDYAIKSIQITLEYLGLRKNTLISSIHFSETKGIEKAERILKICNMLSASHYINPSGGRDLYNKDFFKEKGVKLSFINNTLPTYRQFENEFVAGLSIIDLLMFNSKEELVSMLSTYELV